MSGSVPRYKNGKLDTPMKESMESKTFQLLTSEVITMENVIFPLSDFA